jgi:hypothetical protein
MQEERVLHEAKLAKMEAEMKMVFQQKVQEKEAKLKQSEEELYARHREMKDSLEKQRVDLDDKKRKLESGRPLTPEAKGSVSTSCFASNETRSDDRFSSVEEGPWFPSLNVALMVLPSKNPSLPVTLDPYLFLVRDFPAAVCSLAVS